MPLPSVGDLEDAESRITALADVLNEVVQHLRTAAVHVSAMKDAKSLESVVPELRAAVKFAEEAGPLLKKLEGK